MVEVVKRMVSSNNVYISQSYLFFSSVFLHIETRGLNQSKYSHDFYLSSLLLRIKCGCSLLFCSRSAEYRCAIATAKEKKEGRYIGGFRDAGLKKERKSVRGQGIIATRRWRPG